MLYMFKPSEMLVRYWERLVALRSGQL